MMTQLNASPATSTPCQKLEVASSTAFGVWRKRSSRVVRGRSPCTSSGNGSVRSSTWRACRSIA